VLGFPGGGAERAKFLFETKARELPEKSTFDEEGFLKAIRLPLACNLLLENPLGNDETEEKERRE